MNGLEKSIHELINMLVQYEATTHKSEPAVLVGETSASKAKGKRVGRWKRKKGKGTAVAATTSVGGAPAAPTGKGKGKVGRGIGRWSVHNSSPTQVLERSRKLSKDEMVLRLRNRKAVAAEAVGSLSLMSVPLNTSARGGFSYFITFTDDHSRYGYVYLMRYKSEAFGRFKEYRLEVENQTGCKIKALRSDRGGEYLSGEFIDHLKQNEILSVDSP
ncbi:UNVERIFIED_CONTAM: hypothetical protein Slati_2944000 [Sesamum latifolium]|uniref:Integrase catalytic domain-containing protein n=1 Tax=Sesamum latifolium TaxID=2727402 RepID=A0AAW2VE33_9LAMI